MGGLVAGCAIADFNELSAKPRLLALTINNSCNLSCPHCYLQYAKKDFLISQQRIDRLAKQEFEHLAIVGMEPFLNPRTVLYTCQIAEKAIQHGKSVSVITNGLGLNLLSSEQIKLFDYFDISFDGGPRTYQEFRGASFSRLERNLIQAAGQGAQLNAIHVLYRENILNLNDMASISDQLPISKMMYAPYMVAGNDGLNTVQNLSVKQTINTLANESSFMDDESAFFLIDQYHLDSEGTDLIDITSEIADLSLGHKVHLVPHTPLQIGSVRATYDGLLLSPSQALHPSSYSHNGLPLDTTSLQEAYNIFIEEENDFSDSSIHYGLATG